MVNVIQSIKVAERLRNTSKKRRQRDPCYDSFSRAITILVRELEHLDSLLKQCGVDDLPAFEKRPLIFRILGDYDKTLDDCETIIRKEGESVEDQVRELEARITLHNLKLKALSLSQSPVPSTLKHPRPLHGNDLARRYIDAEVTRSRTRRLGHGGSTQTAAEALRTAFDATIHVDSETPTEDSTIHRINALVRHLSAAADKLENIQERECGILWVRLMTCSRLLAAVTHFNALNPSDLQFSREALRTEGITLQGLITELEMELYRCLQTIQDSLPSIQVIQNLARPFAWMVPEFEDESKPSKEYILCSYLTKVRSHKANLDHSGPLVIGLQRLSDYVLSIDLPTTSILRLDKIDLRSIHMCPSYAIYDAQKIELISGLDDVHLSFKHMSDLCCFQQAITGYRVVHYVHNNVQLAAVASEILGTKTHYFEGHLQLWYPEVLSASAKTAFGRPSLVEHKPFIRSYTDMEPTYGPQGDLGYYINQPYPPLLVLVGQVDRGNKSAHGRQKTVLLSFELNDKTGIPVNEKFRDNRVDIVHRDGLLKMTEYVSSKPDKVDLAVLGRQHERSSGDKKAKSRRLRWIQLDFESKQDREAFTDHLNATSKLYNIALGEYNSRLNSGQYVMG